jgi:hypothetical protein
MGEKSKGERVERRKGKEVENGKVKVRWDAKSAGVNECRRKTISRLQGFLDPSFEP